MKRTKPLECTIEDYQRSLIFLQNRQKQLEKEFMKNRQDQAEIRNKIQKLKDERRRTGE